jgi:hypothetical protein
MVRNGDRAVLAGMKGGKSMPVVVHFNFNIDGSEAEELCQHVSHGIEQLAVNSVIRSNTGSQFRVVRIERVKRVDDSRRACKRQSAPSYSKREELS